MEINHHVRNFFFFFHSLFDLCSMTDQKEKLSALLLKLGEYLPLATEEACKDVYNELSSFALAAERDGREMLTASTTHETRPSDLDGRSSDMKHLSIEKMILCESCLKNYSRELKCENCTCLFRWCCAGYEREPCTDPFSKFTGRCVALQYYCRACRLVLSIAPAHFLQQEQEYLKLNEYFSKPGCKWKWIPCYYDGYSVFTVTWLGLEGIDFLLSAFYCDIGDHSDSRTNVNFLEFVSACASKALELLASRVHSEREMSIWIQLRDVPSSPPKFHFAQFDFAWLAICHHLQSKLSTCIRIWKMGAENTLILDESYNSENDSSPVFQKIDVLMWNSAVATHFDIIVLELPSVDCDFDFDLFN